MSLGKTQAYLDWMIRTEDDERDRREWQEIRHEMTNAEREEFHRWLDSLPHMRDDEIHPTDKG